MKPVASLGKTPGPSDTRRADAEPASQPPGGGSPARQRVGTAEATGVLAQPRPAAPAGSASLARAAAEPLPQASDHSTATVRRSNAQPRTQSFDDVVRVRYFDSSLPARSRSGEGEMPLRNVAHAEPPRRARRPPPPEMQPAAPQAAAQQASRWGDQAAVQAPSHSRQTAPSMPVRKPDREDDDQSV